MFSHQPPNRHPGRIDWTSIFAACGVLFAILMILMVHPVR